MFVIAALVKRLAEIVPTPKATTCTKRIALFVYESTPAGAINRPIDFVPEQLRQQQQHSNELLDKTSEELMNAAATLYLRGETIQLES